MERLSGLDASSQCFARSTMLLHLRGLLVLDQSTTTEPYEFERHRGPFGPVCHGAGLNGTGKRT